MFKYRFKTSRLTQCPPREEWSKSTKEVANLRVSIFLWISETVSHVDRLDFTISGNTQLKLTSNVRCRRAPSEPTSDIEYVFFKTSIHSRLTAQENPVQNP